jgi:hypothetical protein
MRLVFIFLIGKCLFLGAQAYAFSTYKCPQVIKLNVQNFDLEELSESTQDLDPEKIELYKDVQTDLRYLGRLEVKYTLQFAGGAKCYYEGHNQTGQYFRAHIQMVRSASAQTPWFITKAEDYAVKAKLSSLSRSGLVTAGEKVELHHFEKSCPERGCPMVYTYLGTGSIRHLK